MGCLEGDLESSPGGRFLRGCSRYRQAIGIAVAGLAALVILWWPHYNPPAANRSFALLIFTIVLWVTGAMPLFVTALLVPILVVLLRLIRDGEGGAVEAPAAARHVLHAMFGSTIPVLLASFTIASCFLKYEIPGVVDNRLVDWLASQMVYFLLLVMAFTSVLCIGMSNLSAGILTYTLLSGRLASTTVPPLHSKALLMGIAVAANIGGIISPVSSTQNVFAYGMVESTLGLTWWDWMSVTVPCAILSMVACWALLVWIYRLDRGSVPPRDRAKSEVEEEASVESIPSSLRPSESVGGPEVRQPASRGTLAIIFLTTITTIALWSTATQTAGILGGMAIISFLPLVVLFGTGVLEPADLPTLPWDIILLMMGALALVEGAHSSGLLAAMTAHLRDMLGNLHSWSQLAAVSFVLLVMSTFKSHTVAGLIFIPVVAHYVLPLGREGVPLFMSAVMATSIGMAFPFSGLINLMILAVKDGDGNRIVGMRDFLLVGIPASLLTYLVIITITPLLA